MIKEWDPLNRIKSSRTNLILLSLILMINPYDFNIRVDDISIEVPFISCASNA